MQIAAREMPVRYKKKNNKRISNKTGSLPGEALYFPFLRDLKP